MSSFRSMMDRSDDSRKMAPGYKERETALGKMIAEAVQALRAHDAVATELVNDIGVNDTYVTTTSDMRHLAAWSVVFSYYNARTRVLHYVVFMIENSYVLDQERGIPFDMDKIFDGIYRGDLDKKLREVHHENDIFSTRTHSVMEIRKNNDYYLVHAKAHLRQFLKDVHGKINVDF